MDNEFYRQALRRLNERERKILKNLCMGLVDEDSWDNIGISSGTFYKDKANLYAKLDLDATGSYKERKETLHKVICPIFATLEASPQEETNVEATPEMLALAIQDGYEEKKEIALDTSKPIIVIPETKRPRRWWRIILLGLAILIIAGICGVGGYFLGFRKTAQVVVITATQNVQTLIASRMATLSVVPPVIPTDTPLPTNTPESTTTIGPTDTPIPTDTITPKPDYYPQDQPVEIEQGIILTLDPNFGIGINQFDASWNPYGLKFHIINQRNEQYILRFNYDAFKVVDNLGNNYKIFWTGINRFDDSVGLRSAIMNPGASLTIYVSISANNGFALDVKYLMVKVININGIDPIIFRKDV